MATSLLHSQGYDLGLSIPQSISPWHRTSEFCTVSSISSAMIHPHSSKYF